MIPKEEEKKAAKPSANFDQETNFDQFIINLAEDGLNYVPDIQWPRMKELVNQTIDSRIES